MTMTEARPDGAFLVPAGHHITCKKGPSAAGSFAPASPWHDLKQWIPSSAFSQLVFALTLQHLFEA